MAGKTKLEVRVVVLAKPCSNAGEAIAKTSGNIGYSLVFQDPSALRYCEWSKASFASQAAVAVVAFGHVLERQKEQNGIALRSVQTASKGPQFVNTTSATK